MRTYILRDYRSPTDHTDYGPFTVENKDELYKVAYGKVPDGYYQMIAKNGTRIGRIRIDKKNLNRRPHLPKDQYDQLYYYVDPGRYEAIFIKGESPLRVTSPKRYDTLDEVRKSALSRSLKLYKESQFWSGGKPWFVMVFKGTRYLGSVEYDPLRMYDGMWMSAEHPKDPNPLRKDGTIGGKNAVRVIR